MIRLLLLGLLLHHIEGVCAPRSDESKIIDNYLILAQIGHEAAVERAHQTREARIRRAAAREDRVTVHQVEPAPEVKEILPPPQEAEILYETDYDNDKLEQER